MDITRDKSLSMVVAGAGLALGLATIYKYFRSSHEMTGQMRALVDSIDQLKKEVEELRIASQRGSPLQLNSSLFDQSSVVDSSRFAPLASISPMEPESPADDQEEFYDFSDSIGEESLARIDSQLDDPASDKEQLHCQLLELHRQVEDDGEVLIRLAKVTRLLCVRAEKLSQENERKRLALEAVDWAKKAIEKCPRSCEANKWFAIALGSLSDLVPIKEKIENGALFKKHLDIALSIDASDPTLHHMLGRYCLEVAGLKWWERKIAATLFAQVPEASYQEALDHLLRADQLKPGWKENVKFVAEANLAMGRKNEAVKWINQGLDIPSLTEDDELVHKQLETLATKL